MGICDLYVYFPIEDRSQEELPYALPLRRRLQFPDRPTQKCPGGWSWSLEGGTSNLETARWDLWVQTSTHIACSKYLFWLGSKFWNLTIENPFELLDLLLKRLNKNALGLGPTWSYKSQVSALAEPLSGHWPYFEPSQSRAMLSLPVWDHCSLPASLKVGTVSVHQCIFTARGTWSIISAEWA